jgi:acetyltransferase
MPCPGVTRRSVETVVGQIANAAVATDKPVVAGWLGGDPEAPRLLRAAGIPVYPTPERTARAARLLLDAVPTPTDMEVGNLDYSDEALTVLSGFSARSGPLTEQESLSIVGACGVHVARAEYAADAQAAGAAAAKIDGPVALKISSVDLPHKSDAGGVVLNLRGASQTIEAASSMLKIVATRAPDARIKGFLIEEMVSGRVELIVGMHHDDTFGPVVVVGLGGTLVEIAPDRALRVPPFGRGEVRAMLRELRSYAVLESVRGAPAVDIEAVIDVVLRVGELALKAPEIAAIDINPLIVGETGAVAADALVVLRS